jgi:hypothetical protein
VATLPGKDFGQGWERVGGFRIGNRVCGQAGTGDGPATSKSASSDFFGKDFFGKDLVGKRRKTVVADVDRRHGKSRSPGMPRDALRSSGSRGGEGASGTPGFSLRARCFPIQPAKLKRD